MTRVWILVALLVCALGAQSAVTFRLPDFEREIFKSEEIEVDRYTRAGAVGALVALVTRFDGDAEVPMRLRSQALAIAGRLDPECTRIGDALEDLKLKGSATPDTEIDRKRVQERLLYSARRLAESGGEGAIAGAYVADLCFRLDTASESGEAAGQLKRELEQAGQAANWDGLLGKMVEVKEDNLLALLDPNSAFKRYRYTLPGGDADGFAADQREINALVVFRLPSWRQVGTASRMTLTVFDQSSVKGVEFLIAQEVGPEMRNSLEEAVSFMRFRHERAGRVPDGKQVVMVFEDKVEGGKVDGPSAGVAMALAFEGLFAGFEIDPKFACTGAISAGGKIGEVGGVISKTRGAIARGCRRMTVPSGNRRDVSDIALLDGVAALAKIEIFAVEEFGEAMTFATASPEEALHEAQALFASVREVLEESGESILEHESVQGRLEQVLQSYPNHCTARVLLQHGRGEGARHLSIEGSAELIDEKLAPVLDEFIDFLRGSMDGGAIDVSPLVSAAKSSAAGLKETETLIDPRFRPILERAQAIPDSFHAMRTGDDILFYLRRFRDSVEDYEKEKSNLLLDPELKDED